MAGGMPLVGSPSVFTSDCRVKYESLILKQFMFPVSIFESLANSYFEAIHVPGVNF
jgi:hypothetical protein